MVQEGTIQHEGRERQNRSLAPGSGGRPSSDEVMARIGVSRRSGTRVKKILLICIVLAAAVAAAAFLRGGFTKRPTEFETARATVTDLRITVRATGTLQAVTTVEVGAEVTGRVLSVLVDANDIVKKGQVLSQIDREQLEAAVEQSTAQVAAAEAAVMQARVSVNETSLALVRNLRLSQKSLVSQQDIDTAVASKDRADGNLASALANATLAKAALSSAKSRLEKTTILSPIDGSVLSRLVEPGQTVTAGFQTPVLFKLAQDLTQMRLNVDVDEADVGRVREGMEASFTVEAYPDRKFPSKVLSVQNEPKTSQNVVTYKAVLSVDNTERLLRPGMTCTSTIVSDTLHHVLCVPNAALRFTPPTNKLGPPEKKAGVEGEKKQRVWTLKGSSPQALEVRIGQSDGLLTEVRDDAIATGTVVLTDVKEPVS